VDHPSFLGGPRCAEPVRLRGAVRGRHGGRRHRDRTGDSASTRRAGIRLQPRWASPARSAVVGLDVTCACCAQANPPGRRGQRNYAGVRSGALTGPAAPEGHGPPGRTGTTGQAAARAPSGRSPGRGVGGLLGITRHVHGAGLVPPPFPTTSVEESSKSARGLSPPLSAAPAHRLRRSAGWSGRGLPRSRCRAHGGAGPGAVRPALSAGHTAAVVSPCRAWSGSAAPGRWWRRPGRTRRRPR
jgi:hypothetical protein